MAWKSEPVVASGDWTKGDSPLKTIREDPALLERFEKALQAANEAQAAERESEFVEFVNHNLCRVAIRRDSMSAVEIAPPTEHGLWKVLVGTGSVWFHSQSFDTPSEADELFDRLTR